MLFWWNNPYFHNGLMTTVRNFNFPCSCRNPLSVALPDPGVPNGGANTPPLLPYIINHQVLVCLEKYEEEAQHSLSITFLINKGRKLLIASFIVSAGACRRRVLPLYVYSKYTLSITV